jgi:hypothetical protein
MMRMHNVMTQHHVLWNIEFPITVDSAILAQGPFLAYWLALFRGRLNLLHLQVHVPARNDALEEVVTITKKVCCAWFIRAHKQSRLEEYLPLTCCCGTLVIWPS